MKFHFFEDPGHGWLAVERTLVNKLGIAGKISEYSYQNQVPGDTLYLEEDCDAPLLIEAVKKEGGTVELEIHVSDRASFIRRLPPYRPELSPIAVVTGASQVSSR